MSQVVQAARRLATGWTAQVRDFSSFLCVQTGPGVHSASFKMGTGGSSPGIKAAERRTSHPTSSSCRGYVYVNPRIHIPSGPSRPVMEIPLLERRKNNAGTDKEE